MAAAATPSRTDEIRLIWTENQWLYLVAGFISGVIFCLLVQLSISNLPELVISLLPEAAGILLTITVIDALNRRRDKRNAVKQLQEQLIRDAGSTANEVAKNAVHQLRKRRWLKSENGLLAGVDLGNSSLQDAILTNANLQGTNLGKANLQRAQLIHVEMQGAVLKDADLVGADFGQGDDRALFDETTILPDGMHWTPDTDLTKFTHPKTDSAAEQA